MKRERHRWVKLEIHEYVCAKCGIRHTNFEDGPGNWRASYNYPTVGKVRVEHHVPPCERGPLTDDRLAEYGEQIEAALGVNKPGWTPPF